MNKKSNDILQKNVHLLSRLTEQEVRMMPAVEAPLPSVEHVERIVRLVKSIMFPDYFNKRQSDESILHRQLHGRTATPAHQADSPRTAVLR